MLKYLLGFVVCFSLINEAYSQEDTIAVVTTVKVEESTIVDPPPPPLPRNLNSDMQVYKLKPAVDIPVTAVGTGLSLLGFSKIYSKDNTPEEEIMQLRKSDINSFDRFAADYYSEDAAKQSDLLFYGSMPLPVLLLLDKDIRKDAPKIGFLYLEALAITGILYTGSNYFVNRFRPLAYNDEVPMADRQNGGSTNSFIGGHPAMVATSMFFMAKVYSDYHPDSKFRWVMYTAAAAGTAGTAYLRLKAGKHFPSDLLTGMAVGTLSGILVPHFHKNKLINNERVQMAPFYNGMSSGLSLSYRL